MPQDIALIVPCHDEALRLDRPEILRLASCRPGLRLVMVDDGSRDATFEVLEELRRAAAGRISVERLRRNVGKAEAVRHGLRAALAAGARVAGYCDADLSTPVDEMARLVDTIEETGAQAVLGSRVQLLGSGIERRALRHYLGRLFATVASLALRLPVYDTQCGAKLFRSSPALEAALAKPFRSRWIFDVELLERLLRGTPTAAPLAPSDLLEVPVRGWRDVGGSKLRTRAMLRAGVQLVFFFLRSRWRGRRARGTAAPPARTTDGDETAVAAD